MKHKTIKKSDNYKVEGGKIIRSKKFCPKCGAGVFLAEHINRQHCGKCGYSEFKRTQEEVKSKKV